MERLGEGNEGADESESDAEGAEVQDEDEDEVVEESKAPAKT